MRLRAATGSRRPRNPTRQGSGARWDQSAKAPGTSDSGAPGRAAWQRARRRARRGRLTVPTSSRPCHLHPAGPKTVPQCPQRYHGGPPYPRHSRSCPARSPQLTCLAPPPQASSAPPRPGTEDSPQPQPIARRAGIGEESDASVRQSQARLLKFQTNRKATAPPRPARGGERAGRMASVGGAGAPGPEGPRLGRGEAS